MVKRKIVLWAAGIDSRAGIDNTEQSVILKNISGIVQRRVTCMRLVLSNIGMLKSAEINLDKLSVIAGENDNGKSTVGKVVFCIVKAINRYKEDLQESKEFKINERFDRAFFDLRKEVFSFGEDPAEFFDEIHSIKDPELGFLERLNIIASFVERASRNPDVEDSGLSTVLSQHHAVISKLLSEPEDIKLSIENALNKVFSSEFDSSVLLSGEKTGFIRLYEKELKLIDIEVSESNKVKLLSDVEPIELKDVTFIETPLILNYHDLLIRSQTGLDAGKRAIHRLGIPHTTLHTKDLFDKLLEPSIESLFQGDDESYGFEADIGKLLGGSVVYDAKKRDFFFKRMDGEISIKNTAGGIKVFGILQLLLLNGFVNKNTVLIFDEPENHLHPKWQLRLAELLVELADSGVCILLSSHSPYMIEALKRFSDKKRLDGAAGFYFAENNKIENRNRLEDIFSVLAEPFDVFRKMDEEVLRDE